MLEESLKLGVKKESSYIRKNQNGDSFRGRDMKHFKILFILLALQICFSTAVSAEPSVTSQQVKALMNQVGQIGRVTVKQNGKEVVGYTRASWSKEESEAFEIFRKRALENGLSARYDRVGNLYIRTAGSQKKVIQMGSHLDTVPMGGNFDGTAGIVAGFLAITSIHQAGIPLQHALELVIWRGEESATYNLAHKGVKMAFGHHFPKDFLTRTFAGKTLKDEILARGFAIEPVVNGTRLVSHEDLNNIQAHIELHIEQGNKLENDKSDIGIVTSIRGPDRYRIEIFGEFDHSGATPMGVAYRKDANLTIAHIQTALEKLNVDFQKQNKDIVHTVGILNSDAEYNEILPQVHQNALTKVSGYGYFLLDIRSNNKKYRDEFVAKAKDIIAQTTQKLGTRFALHSLGASDPAENLNQNLMQEIEASCKTRKYKYQFLPSGAGHDAAIVHGQKRDDGTRIPVAMIFVPSRGGKSHHPAEFTSIEALTIGTRVVMDLLQTLGTSGDQ
jgi:N-carbamoyl-L-amino-acid hydrolase